MLYFLVGVSGAFPHMNFFRQLLAGAMRRQLSKIDNLYQRHAGEECYLFGNGVSLKWMDLHQFADRPSILGHFMIYHKEASALRIPYCTAIEPFLFWPFFPPGRGSSTFYRHSLGIELRKSILQHPETVFFLNFSNYPVARFPNALYVSRFYQPPFKDKNPFRERQDSHDGTLRFQLSLAIFLGFKKAYLVGHDYTHLPSRSLHFYEKGVGVLEEKKEFNLEFINYAKRFIDLVAVTLESGSEMMEVMTYKDLTGREPHFRENVEIVDRTKLENLATWKGYSIF